MPVGPWNIPEVCAHHDALHINPGIHIHEWRCRIGEKLVPGVPLTHRM
jgi:hypothetical protein